MQRDATAPQPPTPPQSFLPTTRNELAAMLSVATLLFAAQSGTGIDGARESVLKEYSWWLDNLPTNT